MKLVLAPAVGMALVGMALYELGLKVLGFLDRIDFDQPEQEKVSNIFKC